MNVLKKTGWLLLGLLLCGVAWAADDADGPRLYDIELLVFQNLVANDGGEVWPPDYSTWYEETADTAGAATRTVDWLPENSYRLKAERAALDRSSQYRTLAYLAWRQPVVDRLSAQPLELPARPRSGAAWVDGTVKVAVERYLHLHLDLKLHLPDSTIAAGTVTAPGETVDVQTPEIRLDEQRRMRSRELHYFDNPRFGVIALITPYEPPAEAQPAPQQPAPQ